MSFVSMDTLSCASVDMLTCALVVSLVLPCLELDWFNSTWLFALFFPLSLVLFFLLFVAQSALAPPSLPLSLCLSLVVVLLLLLVFASASICLLPLSSCPEALCRLLFLPIPFDL